MKLVSSKDIQDFSQFDRISISIVFLECSTRIEGLCLRNGTEVLTNISFNTNVNDVFWDFVGLIVLATGMHTAAFIGIRHFIQSAGYY